MEDDGDTHLRALIDNIVGRSAVPKSLNTLEFIANDVSMENVVDSDKQGTGVAEIVSERESMGEEGVFASAQTDPSVVEAPGVQPLTVETGSLSHPRLPVHEKTVHPLSVETGSKSDPRVPVHEKTVIFGEEHLRGQCMVFRKEVETGTAVLPTTPPDARLLTVRLSLKEVGLGGSQNGYGCCGRPFGHDPVFCSWFCYCAGSSDW
ncbi:unnamed protein product [Microthlaspi erraticum]|uniref:Uncharacterized protein n=1 Tax=Microthlaspi erraticum TaxID=1685480 RepID=A0A6D2JC90_9BRAS|nr:unnamed protein product [Microthlaspi erraticum]